MRGCLRLNPMRTAIMQDTEFHQLQSAYRADWRCLVMAVEVWQSHDSESVAFEQAAFAVEQAKDRYAESRNRLAAYFLSGTRRARRAQLQGHALHDASATVASNRCVTAPIA